jgi:hypothetical protein
LEQLVTYLEMIDSAIQLKLKPKDVPHDAQSQCFNILLPICVLYNRDGVQVQDLSPGAQYSSPYSSTRFRTRVLEYSNGVLGLVGRYCRAALVLGFNLRVPVLQLDSYSVTAICFIEINYIICNKKSGYDENQSFSS